jgi:carboxymethylenebutenolidase
VDDFDASSVRAPIQAHFAKRDDWAKPEFALAVQKKVEAAGKKMEVHVYNADHAFTNQTRPEVYNAEEAARAWERVIAFMRGNLA